MRTDSRPKRRGPRPELLKIDLPPEEGLRRLVTAPPYPKPPAKPKGKKRKG